MTAEAGKEDSINRRYDSLAGDYDDSFQSGFRENTQNEIVFSTLKELLQDEKCRILDAGGGTGFYSMPFAAVGHEIVILDLSKEMLDVARSKADKLGLSNQVKTVSGDMENLDFPDASFDVILCHLALCHVKHPNRVLKGFRRVLKKGGIVSLIAENKMFFSVSEAFKGNIREATERLRKEPLFVAFGRLGKIRTFDREELLTLVEQTGFEPIRILGLRVISDYMLYAQRSPPEDVEALGQLESILSESESWNSIGRFHFIICRKE